MEWKEGQMLCQVSHGTDGHPTHELWNSINLFKADVGYIHPYVQCKLFKQYCCIFYGAPLWLLSSQGVSDACIAWRKALRKIWKFSPITYCDVVVLVAESKP